MVLRGVVCARRRPAVPHTRAGSTALVAQRCQAQRFTLDSTVVTAVSRFGLPDRPQFDPVTDLEPYIPEHRRIILSCLRLWEA
jgi:hypothetical protein